MMKRGYLFLIVSLLLIPLAFASTQTETIYTMDDTYVNSSSPSTNYDNSMLSVNGSNVETWLRFNLDDAAAPYVLAASWYGYVIYVSASDPFEMKEGSSATWTETNLTWNSKPGLGSGEDSNTVGGIGWYGWDLTGSYASAYDASHSYISYSITGTKNLRFEDKENTGGTGNVPYLNLTTMTPEVSPDGPEDSHSTYDTTIDFSYTTSDAGNVVNCSLVFDGSVNKTNTTGQTNATGSFTLSDIFPGSYTWQISCYDSNREVYQFSTPSRDLDILAKIEWYAPSSGTPLDIGTAVLGGAEPTGSRDVYSNNTNDNVVVSCVSGDCGVVTTDWSTTDMTTGETSGVDFNCSTAAAGSYSADYAVTSDQDGSSDLLTVNCSILAPDLRILGANITFDDSTPTENQVVTISAGVDNIGTSTATDAVVRFYKGYYSLGDQIGGDHQFTLAAGESTTVEQNWTTSIGEYDIYAIVDPNVDTGGVIQESNETNNYAYNTLSISLWTIFVGNVTGSLALQTEDNSTLIRWDVMDTTDSLLYITDTDSSIQFNSLKAFSRDLSDVYQADDFLELDSELNLTSYPDSINLTYTDNGLPLDTRTFKVFGIDIDNVPIVQSTEYDSFVTGILWDASDDEGNEEYDNTTDEDIVFVTMVNQSKVGKYGTYDYEIKVASRLKAYNGPDETTVTFYTEIK